MEPAAGAKPVTEPADGARGARVALSRCNVRRGGSTILDDVSLEIASGEMIVLIGPSGSGKTTLLSALNRLVELDGGTVSIDGTDVRSVAAHELRRRVGYCFQGLGLFPHMTVADNVGITPHLLGWEAARIAARVAELLDLVGLDRSFGARLPSQLSGGQAQRVAVARALAARPQLLLLDEPFGALDPDTRARLQDELASLQRRIGVTTVLVSHDLAEALLLASRIVVLVAGRVAQVGSPRDILDRPASEAVSALTEPARRRAALLGELAAPAEKSST